MEYCANCGNKMEQGDMACTACGTNDSKQQPEEKIKYQGQVIPSADSVEIQQTGDTKMSMSSGQASTSNIPMQPTSVSSNYQWPQQELIYAQDFAGSLLDAIKVFYFEPQNSLSLFGSRRIYSKCYTKLIFSFGYQKSFW